MLPIAAFILVLGIGCGNNKTGKGFLNISDTAKCVFTLKVDTTPHLVRCTYQTNEYGTQVFKKVFKVNQPVKKGDTLYGDVNLYTVECVLTIVPTYDDYYPGHRVVAHCIRYKNIFTTMEDWVGYKVGDTIEHVFIFGGPSIVDSVI